MLTIDSDALSTRVQSAVRELSEGADLLQGLATTLDGYGGLRADADAGEIKQAAISVRATAVQALLMAATAVGISERLSTVAALLERGRSDDAE